LTTTDGRRPRVGFIVTSSGVGGAEIQVRHLARAFAQRGWDVGVISMLPLEEPFLDLGAEGIRTTSLGMRRRVPDPRALFRLRTVLRRWRPDVLHGHMIHANLMARLSRLLVRTPVVVSTMHNQNEGSQWRYVAYRLTSPLSDVTTAVSTGAVAEAVRRGAAPKGGILCVPNGIDGRAYEREPGVRERTRAALSLRDRFTWLAVGRMVDAKGYPDMVAAFRQVHDRYPETRLLIAGTGPLEPLVRTSIAGAGLEEQVTLLGLRSDVPALMQAADGFVMSSAWEGLPMVLLEASASSLPVVATDVGGSRDVVADGVSGYLVPPRSSQALAGAMCRVMALSPGERESMGAAGRDLMSRTFDLEAVVDTWEALYLGRLDAVERRRAGAGGGGR
jgi:glycosyltransferase involved in cell wall biosynthesis